MPTVDLGPCECCGGEPDPCNCQQLEISNVVLSFSFSSAAFTGNPAAVPDMSGFESQVVSFWNGLTVPFRKYAQSNSLLLYHAACLDGTNQAGNVPACAPAPGATNCDSGPYLAYRNPVFEQATSLAISYNCYTDAFGLCSYTTTSSGAVVASSNPAMLATSVLCDVGVDDQVVHWFTGQTITVRNYLALQLSETFSLSGNLCGSAQSLTLSSSFQDSNIAVVHRPYGSHPDKPGDFRAFGAYAVTGSISLSFDLTEPLP